MNSESAPANRTDASEGTLHGLILGDTEIPELSRS
jgi:hypothetical protein